MSPSNSLPTARGSPAVNSFGWGGTNAHVVLRTPPAQEAPAAVTPGPLLLPLTGHSDAALRQRAADLLDVLHEDITTPEVVRLAATLGRERDHFAARTAVVAEDAA